ncbi:RhoGAP domain protein [Oesophagostomum dentatum]|uniref:RhoGAP domain protein n=1 Tax=Oesophagostomum dentatum TaxID=61180 RepID=A0A0B1TM40_OESDE|nr:RhoGAP domain protein [Oesophagostomum dentatum]
MIDFEVSSATTSAIRGRFPGESSCGPAGSIHRLGNVHSFDIVIEVTIREGNRHGTTKIKLQQVPKFLINAFEFISCRGMDMEGLFRREGNAARLNQNNYAVYIGSAPIPSNFSVHDVCSMVKRFFRDLKEPLLYGTGLRDRLFELVQKNRQAHVTRQEFAAVFEPELNPTKKNVASCLPRAHLGTLGYLMRQLYRISHYSSKHQMTSLNLATVFAPTLFRDEVARDKARRKERRGSQDDILLTAREDTQLRIEAVHLLIEHANWIGLHPNCYLTSGHPRSSSAAPSPRQPPFLNVANLKEPPFVDRKHSMKDRIRENRETKTNRRASSPAVVVPNDRRGKDLISVKNERKISARPMLEFADSHTDQQQPAESHNGRSRDLMRSSGARTSRSRQHQSQGTSNAQQKLLAQQAAAAQRVTKASQSTGRAVRHTVDSSMVAAVVRRDSGKKRRESPPPMRASKVLKDTPISLVSHEHFLSSYGEGRERSRRRHTTPVKTSVALRRNQPNTVQTGLRQPKRRATVINAGEQEKENRVAKGEVSASSSCEDLGSSAETDNSTMLTESSADLLAQKGQESRLRRAKRQQRKELSSILQHSLLDSSQDSSFFAKDRTKGNRMMVSTACSPIVFPSPPSTDAKETQRAHGSAVVGETVVVSTAQMLSPSADEQSLLNLPTDLSTSPPPPKPKTSVPSLYFHPTVQSPPGTVTMVSKQIAPASFPLKPAGASPDSSRSRSREDQAKVIFRVPSLPPQQMRREEVCTTSRIQMNKDRHAEGDKQYVSSSKLPAKPLISAFPRSTSVTTSFNSSVLNNYSLFKPQQLAGMEHTSSNDESKDSVTSDDDMFAASNEIKSAILNSTSELDINAHMDRQLRCRPSIALIEKQGIVSERVKHFRRLGNCSSVPLEPISGRSSGLSSRSSIGAGSVNGDDDCIKPSAPPVTHSLNMGAGGRRNSTTPVTTSVSQLSSQSPK